MDLGGGVAFRVVSPTSIASATSFAERLHGLLGAQDRGGWRPHVTIQNKVAAEGRARAAGERSSGTSRRGRWRSAGSACTAISAGRGRRSRPIAFRGR